jgi:NAD(P)-dependent dehydrogenase (short-subunit alcohol dehydrogenase family)
MREFRDRVAVVTGAASGIGRALAERLAREGMKLVLADVDATGLAEAAGALRARGAQALAVPTDVTRADQVSALAERTLAAYGGVHVVCNNAGVFAAGPSWQAPLSDWEFVLGVNLWGVIHGIRVFLPIMLGQDADGHVVNTASMAGLVSGAFNAIYNVSKHGVVTLSETLQQELALTGARVRVSVLCPGWVNTRIMDADRNRPAALAAPVRNPTPEETVLTETVRGFLASGLPPARVAELVVEAVRGEKFYVLTHPEWKGLIRTRMEDILAERQPTFVQFS